MSTSLSLAKASIPLLTLTLLIYYHRWSKTQDYFTPSDRVARNFEVEADVMSLSFDYESKYLAASKCHSNLELCVLSWDTL